MIIAPASFRILSCLLQLFLPGLSIHTANDQNCHKQRQTRDHDQYQEVQRTEQSFEHRILVTSTTIVYCAVSVKVATGCPNPYGPSAVTVTCPAVDGSVSVTFATPLPSVTAIILVPPFDNVP